MTGDLISSELFLAGTLMGIVIGAWRARSLDGQVRRLALGGMGIAGEALVSGRGANIALDAQEVYTNAHDE